MKWLDRLRCRVWWLCMFPVVLVVYPHSALLGMLDEQRGGCWEVLRDMWQGFKRGEA